MGRVTLATKTTNLHQICWKIRFLRLFSGDWIDTIIHQETHGWTKGDYECFWRRLQVDENRTTTKLLPVHHILCASNESLVELSSISHISMSIWRSLYSCTSIISQNVKQVPKIAKQVFVHFCTITLLAKSFWTNVLGHNSAIHTRNIKNWWH